MIEGLAEYAGFLFLKRVAQVVAEFTGRTATFPGEPGYQGWSRKVFFSRGVAGGAGRAMVSSGIGILLRQNMVTGHLVRHFPVVLSYKSNNGIEGYASKHFTWHNFVC